MFTICMLGFEGPIKIGGEYTSWIFFYLLDNWGPARYLKSFCFQSVILLDILSSKLGLVIYIYLRF